MPEPGYSATSSPSKSTSSPSSSSSSTSSDESKSSSSSETKTESIASSPTTEEKLSGESKSNSKSAPENHHSDSDSDTDKASSSKSKDAKSNGAPKSGEGSRAAAESSASGANSDSASNTGQITSSIEPVTREAIEPGASAASDRAADVARDSLSDTSLDTSSTDETPAEQHVPQEDFQSLTTPGSVIGDSLQGTVDVVQHGIDRTGREAAGDILTKGPGGNLPAPGFGSRTELASRFNEPLMTSAKALDETPFSAKAASTKVLSETAEVAGKLSVASKTLGNAVGPIIGFGESLKEDLGPDATTGEKMANGLGGALKEADDGIISGGAGTLVGAGQATIGSLVSTTGIGAPAGVAMVYTAPVTGAAVSVGMSLIYDNSGVDRGIDSFVDNHVEPAAAAVIDTSITVASEAVDMGQSGASWASSKFDQAAETVRGWFR